MHNELFREEKCPENGCISSPVSQEGEDGVFEGLMFLLLSFTFQHLGQTVPQVLQPSAPGIQAKTTGRASGSVRINEGV